LVKRRFLVLRADVELQAPKAINSTVDELPAIQAARKFITITAATNITRKRNSCRRARGVNHKRASTEYKAKEKIG
jgi:hypothetical protein